MQPGAPLSQSTAGIWLRGRWVSFRQEEGRMWPLWEGCYVSGGGVGCVWVDAKFSVAERRICDVNTRGADENMHVEQGHREALS